MPLIDHVPPATTVVVLAGVLWPPLLATTEIVAPTSPVPLILVLVLLELLIELVTVVTAMAGACVSLVAVPAAVAELPTASVAVTL